MEGWELGEVSGVEVRDELEVTINVVSANRRKLVFSREVRKREIR